jgi:hypothetical protein
MNNIPEIMEQIWEINIFSIRKPKSGMGRRRLMEQIREINISPIRKPKSGIGRRRLSVRFAISSGRFTKVSAFLFAFIST